jgi:hypothetical protein
MLGALITCVFCHVKLCVVQKVRSDFHAVATPKDRVYGQYFDLIFFDLRVDTFANEFSRALENIEYHFEKM